MNWMLSNINMDVVCQFKEVNDAENVIKKLSSLGVGLRATYSTYRLFILQGLIVMQVT